jgi:16S rRNA (guanine966-N2)-methyltransferase
MARVIAGEARGRRLAVPPGLGTRPTSDRAREGLFAAVTSMTGSFEGARVLDLYAGSGAVGLEALSRGAAHALMVEADRAAVRVIRANIEAVGLPGAEVVSGRVERLVARRPAGGEGSYDIVFADPPYATPDAEVTRVLEGLAGDWATGEARGDGGDGGDGDAGGWLTPAALVVVERATRSGPLHWPEGYLPDRSRRYGEATFWYGRGADVTTGAGVPGST